MDSPKLTFEHLKQLRNKLVEIEATTPIMHIDGKPMWSLQDDSKWTPDIPVFMPDASGEFHLVDPSRIEVKLPE